MASIKVVKVDGSYFNVFNGTIQLSWCCCCLKTVIKCRSFPCKNASIMQCTQPLQWTQILSSLLSFFLSLFSYCTLAIWFPAFSLTAVDRYGITFFDLHFRLDCITVCRRRRCLNNRMGKKGGGGSNWHFCCYVSVIGDVVVVEDDDDDVWSFPFSKERKKVSKRPCRVLSRPFLFLPLLTVNFDSSPLGLTVVRTYLKKKNENCIWPLPSSS